HFVGWPRLSALLDSHALVWWMSGNARLSVTARSMIETDDIFVSAATAYELAAKVRRGKLPEADALIADFDKLCAEQRFALLPITVRHALQAASFEQDHRDPFDRLIAAQSLAEGLPVISLDPALSSFGCQIIW
ncbi:MAG: type II toxin-antitoxin system VapC family toxin, partial [Rhizobiaceae bacterium]